MTGMDQVIVGQKHLVESLLIGLLSDGHILLEGVPGLAKTLAIKTRTAGVTGPGRLGTCGVEEATSPSTAKSTEVSAWCSMICTIMLGQGIKQKPNV